MAKYKTCSLSEIGEIVSGATPKTNVADNFGGNIAWLTPADLSGYSAKYVSHGARNLTEKGYSSCGTKLMPQGTVLFSSRAPIGYVAIASNPICTNQGFKSIVPHDDILSEFLYYQLKFLRKSIQDMGSGTTFKEISAKKFATIRVVLPPLPEQKRIVARIEELFSELDNGVDTLKKTKQQLTVYRQSVLKAAFEGIATQCEVCNVKDVCEDIKVGIVIKPSQYYTTEDHGIRAFRSANVREFQINDADWVYLTKAGHNANRRSEIHTGDVLVVRSGYPGTACVVTPDFDGCNAIDILIAVPDKRKVLPEYLCAYTNSPLGRKIVQEKKRGVAQAHFNVSGYALTTILLPSLQLQKQVVSKIDESLSACDSIEKTVDTALQQAESLRQSILKKAFEGGM